MSNLRDRYIIPPFSILDAGKREWQARKKAWLSLGIDSEKGRDTYFDGLKELQEKVNGDCSIGAAVSIFDPVLCEIIYNWFTGVNSHVLDPFAGGSVRGIVASKLCRKYTGIELRKEQIIANRKQAKKICYKQPTWICGDSLVELDSLENNKYDFLFSCPPYLDLEKYSNLENDLSNMDSEQFFKAYYQIIKKSYDKLKNNTFACFVVGEVRNKNGEYHNFVGETIRAFLKAGFKYHNEMILKTANGSAHLRASNFDSNRRVVKNHQNVLVFIKGDPKIAVKKIGKIHSFKISDIIEDAEKYIY